MNPSRAKLLESIRKLLERLPDEQLPVCFALAARVNDDRTFVHVGFDDIDEPSKLMAISAVAKHLVDHGARLDAVTTAPMQTMPTPPTGKPS